MTSRAVSAATVSESAVSLERVSAERPSMRARRTGSACHFAAPRCRIDRRVTRSRQEIDGPSVCIRQVLEGRHRRSADPLRDGLI